MADIILYSSTYMSTDLSKKYYSLRDFVPQNADLNSIPFALVNDDLSISIIDHFDGETFISLDIWDIPFAEYDIYEVHKVELIDGGLGADIGNLQSIIELYENIEKWCSGHPIATMFLAQVIAKYGIPRFKNMLSVLKAKGLKDCVNNFV